MQLEKLLEKTIKEKLKNGYEIDYISEQLNEINEKINEITNEGYSYIKMQNITLRSHANYVGSYGHFNPDEVDNLEGKEYSVLIFENDKKEKRYCIVNEDLDIIKQPLSKLKYYDRTIEEDANYKLYMEVKKTILPELQKLGIEITPQEAFLTFSDSDLSNSKNIATAFIKELKNAVLRMTEIEAEISNHNNPVSEGPIKINYNFSHEMLACGQDRQADATYALTQNLNGYRNSSEMNYIANFLYNQIRKMSEKMYFSGEFTPTIDVAEKMGIKDIILEDIINRKDEEAFKKFLRIEMFEKDKEGNILKSYKPFPKALEKALVDEFRKEPCELKVSKIHSSMRNMLTLIRKLNPELKNNTIAAQAIVEFAKTSEKHYSFANIIAQPTFIKEFESGKKPSDFIADMRNSEWNDKYSVSMAFNRLELKRMGITDETTLFKLAYAMYDEEIREEIRKQDKDTLNKFANALSMENITLSTNNLLCMIDYNISLETILEVSEMEDFNFDQKLQIALGIESGINVELYKDPAITSENMQDIRISLTNNEKTIIESTIESIDVKELSRLLSGFESSLKPDNDIYGGYGPGSFDNRGGYQEINLFGKSIAREELQSTFGGGSERDARLWAHNWYTEFDFEKLERQTEFCKNHKLAVTIAVLGNITQERQSFEDLEEQVALIEKTLKEIYNVDLDKLDIEKYCELLKEGNSIENAASIVNGENISKLIDANTIDTPIDDTKTTITPIQR